MARKVFLMPLGQAETRPLGTVGQVFLRVYLFLEALKEDQQEQSVEKMKLYLESPSDLGRHGRCSKVMDTASNTGDIRTMQGIPTLVSRALVPFHPMLAVQSRKLFCQGPDKMFTGGNQADGWPRWMIPLVGIGFGSCTCRDGSKM